MTSPVPSLAPRGGPGDALSGLALPFRAAALIIRTPSLLGLSLLSAAVTGATLVGVGVGAWRLAQWAAHALVSGDGWWQVASVGLAVVLFLAFFVVGALTAPNVLLAPLQDPLSEATETRCGDFTAPPFSLQAVLRGTVFSLQHTLLRLLLMAAGLVVLFPLNLVPVAGSVLWLVLSSVWTMFWLAVEHLSGPMARHLRPFGEVVRALRGRPALALGFGAALYAMLWVPVVNFFLLPVAVVAGTLLFRALKSVDGPVRERSA